MRWKVLVPIVSFMVVAAAIGRTVYTTNFQTPATGIRNAQNGMPAPLQESAATLGAKDGLAEAHADGLTDTVRVKRLQMTDASTLLTKVCTVIPNHLPWIKRVRVYAPDTADTTNTMAIPELDQSCQ